MSCTDFLCLEFPRFSDEFFVARRRSIHFFVSALIDNFNGRDEVKLAFDMFDVFRWRHHLLGLIVTAACELLFTSCDCGTGKNFTSDLDRQSKEQETKYFAEWQFGEFLIRFGLEQIRYKSSLVSKNDNNILWKRIVAIPRIKLRHGAALSPNHTEVEWGCPPSLSLGTKFGERRELQ